MNSFDHEYLYDLVLNGEQGELTIIPPLADKHYDVLAKEVALGEESEFSFTRGKDTDSVTLRGNETVESTDRYVRLREFFKLTKKTLQNQTGVLVTYVVDYNYEAKHRLSE
jgi:hypothetical protein